MDSDEKYMNRCLQLAGLGNGNVMPNPMVGAVLVYQDKIIGEGYHMKYGEAHAEVNCLNSVKETDRHLLQNSTLYVSLEPCVHYGKTPPCADLIIRNNIPKVVIGCQDVFNKVNGKGIEKLQSASIDVTTGVLEKECTDVNKRFFKFQRNKAPYVILKWTQSSNGLIAGKNRRTKISNAFTDQLVHKWRSQEAAILVGTNTALIDDPELTNRYWTGNSPVRVVIDMDQKLPEHLKIFNRTTKTIVFNGTRTSEEENLVYYKIDKNNILPEILQSLYEMNLQSVLVEGGAKVLQSFIDKQLWDEARIITNEQMVINEGLAAPVLSNCHITKSEMIESDRITYYENSFGNR